MSADRLPSSSPAAPPVPGVPLRRNIELKARLADIERARELAGAIATDRLAAEHQIDTYFCAAHGRLKLREIDGRSAQLIWYERSNASGSRPSDYLLAPVVEPALLKAALGGALGIVGVVEKRREIYLFHNVRIHLDRVLGRGEFLELEAVQSEHPSSAEAISDRQRLDWLRRRFDIADEDLLSGSYGDF